MGSSIIPLYPTLRLLGGKSWHYQKPQRHHQWPGCIPRNKVKFFLNKKLSNYRPVTSASWEGSAPSLIPNEDCGAGRWIPQLTKQLVNNRTGRGQRLSFENNESAL